MGRSKDIAPHLTVEERIDRGREARKEVPRSAHATWAPARFLTGHRGVVPFAVRKSAERV
jgi:hypothetical protein